MSSKYAVVDLEATGLSANATIIQVGIVIIENGRITQTFETDVNPHQPLSEHIIKLTGISDEQLKLAPDFSQVAGEIYHLIEDCIFVAHNVKFDANLLAEQLFLEGYELRSPRIDTVELTQVLYPDLEKYSLAQLADALGIELAQAHTAIADAKATAEIFLLLQKKLASLPLPTLRQLANLADCLVFESRILLDEALTQRQTESLAAAYQLVDGLVLRKRQTVLKKRQLSRDFEKNIALLGLTTRKEQDLFAEKVYQGIFDDRPSLIQAPAGIGKTLGYLLPLLSHLSQQQLILALPTKLLQDQVMAQEAKRLAQVFHISSQSIKAPSNYLSLDAFKASLTQSDDNRLLNRYKMRLLVWLCETETGDLDEIRQKQGFEPYFDSLRHNGKVKEQSPFKDVDFWYQVDSLAKKSQVLVTNQAYLLERSQRDRTFLAGKTLVIDEAHQLFQKLEEFSRRQVSIEEILSKIDGLLASSDQQLTIRLLESLQFELGQLIELSNLPDQEREAYLAGHIEKIRQDVIDLNHPDLVDLAACLSLDYPMVWLEKIPHPLLKSSRTELTDCSHLLIADKVYLISATLALTSKTTVGDLLQLKDYRFERIAEGVKGQQKIWLDSSMPDVTRLPETEGYSLIADSIKRYASLKKPLFVLFTSKKAMFSVSDLLEKEQLSHLCQERSGSNYMMKKRFDQGDSPILLATGSFWEGVDFYQQDQMIQLITRLPFDNPKDKLVEKIYRDYHYQGKNPFEEYSLPVMILRLI